MRKAFYVWTRDLHLYLGLALSPFVLLFAASVILLDHPSIPLGGAGVSTQSTAAVQLPPNLEQSDGMARAQSLQQVMRQVGVTGEIGYIIYNPGRGSHHGSRVQAGQRD